MYDKLLKWSGIIGSCLMLLMIVGMLYYSSQKSLVYVQAEEQYGTAEYDQEESIRELIQITPEARENQNKFYIPVVELITQDAIHIENDSMNRRLKITIDGMNLSFFEKNVMYGKLDGILQIQAGEQKSGIVLYLIMDHIYEYEAVLENQKLGLIFQRPAEIYDRIVVLDAGHGGSDEGIRQNGIVESEFCMELAERVKAKLETEGICVYLTRGVGENPDMIRRASFAQETEADLFLSIHLSEGEEYGISAYYNDTYFIPGLNNVMFADYLVKETSAAVNNRGTGVFAVEQTDAELLCAVETIAARLDLGCPADLQEAALLKRDDYKDDLAEGISRAIQECLDER